MEKKPELILIVASTINGDIGYKGSVPWTLKGDLPRFKYQTTGNVLIIGRSTHESMPESMPGRIRVVLTRDPGYASQIHDPENGIYSASSFDEAVEKAKSFNTEAIFFAGGASIYEEAMSIVDKAYVTLVHKSAPRYDTWIKDFSFPVDKWVLTSNQCVEEPDAQHPEFVVPSHSYLTFERIEPQE